MAALLSESLLLRVLRWASLVQYAVAALAFFVNLALCLEALLPAPDLVFVTVQATASQRGQLNARAVPTAPNRPYLVDKSKQQRLIYHEPSAAKRLALALLGVTNSSLGRASLITLLFAMLAGRLIYHMLRDMRLATPFTEANARRIRWLALLVLGIDAYAFLAHKALQALVPAFAYGAGGSNTVTPYIVLDPAPGGWGSWKFGLLLLIVAVVYKRGVAMAREAELTI